MDNATVASSRQARIAVPAGTAGLAVAANAISRCVAWIRNRERIRQDIDALMALDDHLLADIGLERDEVEAAVRSGHLPGGRDDAGTR